MSFAAEERRLPTRADCLLWALLAVFLLLEALLLSTAFLPAPDASPAQPQEQQGQQGQQGQMLRNANFSPGPLSTPDTQMLNFQLLRFRRRPLLDVLTKVGTKTPPKFPPSSQPDVDGAGGSPDIDF